MSLIVSKDLLSSNNPPGKSFVYQCSIECTSYITLFQTYGCKKVLTSTYFFNKQLGSGFSPENCLYFQGFRDSKLLNGCLVV